MIPTRKIVPPSSNSSLRCPGLPLSPAQKPSRNQISLATLNRSAITDSKSSSVDGWSFSPSSVRASEAEVEQAKAQEVTPKKAIDASATGVNEIDHQSENAQGPDRCRQNPDPISSACLCITRVAKLIEGERYQGPHTAVSHPALVILVDAIGCVLSFIGPWCTGKTTLGQLIARALYRLFQRIGGVHDEAEIWVTVRLALLAALVYLRKRYARLVVWIRFYYCKHFTSFPESANLMTKIMTETNRQSNYHDDPSAAPRFVQCMFFQIPDFQPIVF